MYKIGPLGRKEALLLMAVLIILGLTVIYKWSPVKRLIPIFLRLP